MTRFAALLLIVGLAAGLWLGFNPATHRQLIRFWDDLGTSQAQAQPIASVQIRQWDSRVGVWLRSLSQPRSTLDSRPVASPTWRRITAAWRAFGRAMDEIWVSMFTKIKAGV